MEMDWDINPTTLKLMMAFREFHKSNLQDRPIAGCKPSEFRLLFCIKLGRKPDADYMKVSEISKLLQVTSPTVTQLLKGLEANGLIERHIDLADRRAVDIKLTAQGEMLIKQARKAFTETMDGLVEYLGEEESTQLAELLSKSCRYFGEREARMRQSQWNGDEKA